jgi:hypothetical protein
MNPRVTGFTSKSLKIRVRLRTTYTSTYYEGLHKFRITVDRAILIK